jgi:hypothetical protein
MDYYDEGLGQVIDIPNLPNRGPRRIPGKMLPQGRGGGGVPGNFRPAPFQPPGLTGFQGGDAASKGYRQALGFPVQTFTQAGGETVLTAEATPQRNLKPVRLVINISKLAGATEGINIHSLKIGADEMLPSSDPVPASVFAADSVETSLVLEGAKVGNTISIEFQPDTGAVLSVAGSSIVVSTVMFCLLEEGAQNMPQLF